MDDALLFTILIINTVVQALLNKLKNEGVNNGSGNNGVIAGVLATVGELARVVCDSNLHSVTSTTCLSSIEMRILHVPRVRCRVMNCVFLRHNLLSMLLMAFLQSFSLLIICWFIHVGWVYIKAISG